VRTAGRDIAALPHRRDKTETGTVRPPNIKIKQGAEKATALVNSNTETNSATLQQPPITSTVIADSTAPLSSSEIIDSLPATPQDTANAPKPKAKKRKVIEAGVVVNFGSSGVTTSFLDGFGEKALSDYVSVPVQNNAGGGAPLPPSPIQRGLYYALGIAANYELGAKGTISAGLQYQRLNTEIQVGTVGDSALSYLRMGTAYFNNDGRRTSYTNAFHFLTLPLSYRHQLHKKAPVHLAVGLSLSRLLSTNALHYNPSGNIYYGDSSSMKKTTAGVFTSLTYELNLKKGTRLGFGPQFQYSLTPTSKSSATKPQHLYTFGLTSTLTFK
jgi:hypothetical protein